MRSRTARFTSMALGLVAAIGPAGGASAYWTAGGSGTASATTGNLSSPTGVTATQPTAGVATIRVTWTAPGAPSVAPAGYYVQRFVGATASPACGSSPTSLLPVTPTACDDTGVVPGSYSYRVTAVVNSWTATSASSGSVTLSVGTANTAPAAGTVGTTVALSGSGFSPNTAITATYNGSPVTLSGTTTTDSSGMIPTVNPPTFTVPPSTAGAHPVVVTVGAVSAPPISFTVRPSVGAPSPMSGSAGSSVTIAGSGFAAGSALTAKVGGTTATIRAGASSDASGSLNTTFTVPAQPAGAYTVSVADAAGNTATSATSFTIVAGPATKLAFTAQPASGANVQATGTGTFSASVAVQDASGNVRTTDNTTLVTLAIGTNPSAGVLACTNVGGVGPVLVTNGVANFTECSITKVGIGYKLTATSSPGLTAPANANSFNVTAGTAVGIILSDITVSPTPALGAPIGVVGSLAYSSVTQPSNGGNVLTARISLADQNQNLVTNGTGSTITVGLSVAGSGTVTPSTLSIANGASTSSVAFTLTRATGLGKAVTLTAAVTGTTQALTVLMAS